MGMSKMEIRAINKDKRSRMTLAEVKEKSSEAARTFLTSDIYKKAKTIMAYMPLGNETDTKVILDAAFCDGKRVVLPVTEAVTGEITPYYVSKGTKLVKGAFGVSEPCGTDAAQLLDIDVVLLPGVAFDGTGNRVGFGKGCYDRFLENFNGIKMGYCYQFQTAEKIEAEPHDIKVDFLITEKGLIKTRAD